MNMLRYWLIFGAVATAYGQRIQFSSSPARGINFQVDKLVLRCSLNNEIGTPQRTRKKVSSVDYISVKRDGKPVARVASILNYANESNLQVTGRVYGQTPEDCYLEMIWANPSQSQVGSYICEIGVVDESNQNIELKKSIEVHRASLTLNQVSDYILEFRKWSAELRESLLQPLPSFDIMNARLNKKARALETMNSRLSQRERDLQTSWIQIQGTLETMNSSVIRTERPLQNMNRSVIRIERPLQTTNNRLILTERALQTMNSSLILTERPLQTMNSRLIQIQGTLETMNSSLILTERPLQTMNSRLIQIQGTLETMNSSLIQTQRTLQTMNSDLTQTQRRLQSMHTETGVSRCGGSKSWPSGRKRTTIKFKRPYDVVPKVTVRLIGIDVSNAYNVCIRIKVLKVNTTEFTFECKTWGLTIIYETVIDWIVTN